MLNCLWSHGRMQRQLSRLDTLKVGLECLEFPANKDRFGLGYHSQQLTLKKTTTKASKGQVLPLPDIFTSDGNLVDVQINMVEEEDNFAHTVGLVYQKIDGQ